jgi:preprotein translocase subunit YajC
MQAVFAAAGEPAGTPAEGTGPTGPPGGMWLMVIGFVAIFYFLMIRPNQKREKERREMLASLSKGDSVVTNGGICGTIVGLDEKTVVLRISENPPVKVEFLRQAVSRAVSPDNADQQSK